MRVSIAFSVCKKKIIDFVEQTERTLEAIL